MICYHENQDWPHGHCKYCYVADHVVLNTILPIYNSLVEEARKFCRRVEAGQIQSRRTYRDMKRLVEMAEKAAEV